MEGAPKQPERIAKLQTQIEASCKKHGVIKVWEAFRRFRGNSDVHELPSLGIDPPFTLDQKLLCDLHDRLPKEYTDKENIVFYLNTETLETRHVFIPFDQDTEVRHQI